VHTRERTCSPTAESDTDALRKAALEVDLPEGGTMLGFGVGGEETNAAGQNDRAFPVIIQYIDDKSYVAWPKSLQTRERVLSLPASSPYVER
jgi:branched-chain amino acid transport system substrate-binding protein